MAVKGIGGAGAPHVFEFDRRDNVAGPIQDDFWGTDTHPDDVILRSLGFY